MKISSYVSALSFKRTIDSISSHNGAEMWVGLRKRIQLTDPFTAKWSPFIEQSVAGEPAVVVAKRGARPVEVVCWQRWMVSVDEALGRREDEEEPDGGDRVDEGRC
ncbi:uncharacterized protein A4U43_C03F12220 [Asparagus officinalis]|uniref:Uncharacterized protein n=1 Tax=Asparagus officinalis TaxID=4686 RepID=A0A5P1F9G7_ASPOF|nr:uncharacterized protein A4U43_C03F12220 [Asparagus officinalis]